MRLAPSNVNLASKLADLGLLQTAQTLQNGNPFLNPPTKLLDPTESNTSCRNSNKNYTSICELSISRSDMHACMSKKNLPHSKQSETISQTIFKCSNASYTHQEGTQTHTTYQKSSCIYTIK